MGEKSTPTYAYNRYNYCEADTETRFSFWEAGHYEGGKASMWLWAKKEGMGIAHRGLVYILEVFGLFGDIVLDALEILWGFAKRLSVHSQLDVTW